ncbi:uncharacterized protein LOC128211588 [Mya arenaria]|uniref:uncharacterized protein LOC128211588 n=1 Tax=Mya arenaria TaxID=6604 RepID=UPI0022E493F8|nr:uncharacterized protein LOC128211588 [Mya arenaria]
MGDWYNGHRPRYTQPAYGGSLPTVQTGQRYEDWEMGRETGINPSMQTRLIHVHEQRGPHFNPSGHYYNNAQSDNVDYLPEDTPGYRPYDQSLQEETNRYQPYDQSLPKETPGYQAYDQSLPEETPGYRAYDQLWPEETRGYQQYDQSLPEETSGYRAYDQLLPGETPGYRAYDKSLSGETPGYQPYDTSLPDETQRYQPYDQPLPEETQRYQPYDQPLPEETPGYRLYDQPLLEETPGYQPYDQPLPEETQRYQPYDQPLPEETQRYRPYDQSLPEERYQPLNQLLPGKSPGHHAYDRPYGGGRNNAQRSHGLQNFNQLGGMSKSRGYNNRGRIVPSSFSGRQYNSSSGRGKKAFTAQNHRNLTSVKTFSPKYNPSTSDVSTKKSSTGPVKMNSKEKVEINKHSVEKESSVTVSITLDNEEQSSVTEETTEVNAITEQEPNVAKEDKEPVLNLFATLKETSGKHGLTENEEEPLSCDSTHNASNHKLDNLEGNPLHNNQRKEDKILVKNVSDVSHGIDNVCLSEKMSKTNSSSACFLEPENDTSVKLDGKDVKNCEGFGREDAGCGGNVDTENQSGIPLPSIQQLQERVMEKIKNKSPMRNLLAEQAASLSIKWTAHQSTNMNSEFDDGNQKELDHGGPDNGNEIEREDEFDEIEVEFDVISGNVKPKGVPDNGNEIEIEDALEEIGVEFDVRSKTERPKGGPDNDDKIEITDALKEVESESKDGQDNGYEIENIERAEDEHVEASGVTDLENIDCADVIMEQECSLDKSEVKKDAAMLDKESVYSSIEMELDSSEKYHDMLVNLEETMSKVLTLKDDNSVNKSSINMKGCNTIRENECSAMDEGNAADLEDPEDEDTQSPPRLPQGSGATVRKTPVSPESFLGMSDGDYDDDDDDDDDDLLQTAPAFLKSVDEIISRPLPATPTKLFKSSQDGLNSSGIEPYLDRESPVPKQMGYNLDSLLDAHREHVEVEKEMCIIEQELKDDIQKGGFARILEKPIVEVTESPLPEEHAKLLQHYDVHESKIRSYRPGLDVFHRGQYLCRFGPDLRPSHCGFKVKEGLNIEKMLNSVTTGQLKTILFSGIIQLKFDKIPCKNELLRWLFFLMSVQKEYILQTGCCNLILDILKSQADKEETMWAPSLPDIVSVFLNFGGQESVLLPSSAITESLRETYFQQPEYEPSVQGHAQGYKELDMTLVLKVLTHALYNNSGVYSGTELNTILYMLYKASLDQNLKNLSLFGEFQECITQVIQNYTDQAWRIERLTVCRMLANLCSHHHDKAHTIHLIPPTPMGVYLQRRVGYIMIHTLLDSAETFTDDDLSCLEIQDLVPFVDCLKELLESNPYLMSSIVTILDNCVGPNITLSSHEREQLKSLLEKLRRVRVKDDLSVMDRTMVKDMIARLTSKWTLDIQTTKHKQMKLFEFTSPMKTKITKVEHSQDTDSDDETPNKIPRVAITT